MRLYLNNEPVDFTLESEKTLADVVHSLERWLAERKLTIISLAVDGVPMDDDAFEEKKSRPIETIDEIRATASDFLKLAREGVHDLISFFESLSARLEAGDADGAAGVLSAYPHAANTLRFVLPENETEEIDARRADLDKTFSGTTAGMIAFWDKKTFDKAIGLCRFFLDHLRRRQADFERIGRTTKRIAAETAAALRTSAERLKEVPVLLQSGKDGEAMQAIASFTESAQLFLALLANLVAAPPDGRLHINGLDLQSFSRDLNGRLRELVEAFEKKDYILIGDLCEYEIAPQLLSLIDKAERELSTPSQEG